MSALSLKWQYSLFFVCCVLNACSGMPKIDEQAQQSGVQACGQAGSVPNDRNNADPEQLKLIAEGKQHYRRGQYGLAEQSFRRAVEMTADVQRAGSKLASLEAWYGLAASYDQLARFDMSDPIYITIEQMYGASVTYYNNYGYSLELRGDDAAARQQYELATKLAPNCQISKNNLGSMKFR